LRAALPTFRRPPRRRPLALVLGVIALQLVMVTSAIAVSWSPVQRLTLTRNGTVWDSLVTAGASSAHVAYQEARGGILGIYYRRSTNSGTTWAEPVRLSDPAGRGAWAANLAVYGTTIDAVYIETQPGATVAWYRRSTNNGATWGSPLRLSSTTGLADFPQVARDSAGRVLVAWTDGKNGRILTRRSTNGGVSFLSTVSIGTTTAKPYDSSYLEGFPQVAAGNGVLYIAWYSTDATLRVRRSTNGGSSWLAGANVATDGSGYHLDLAASGSSAVLGYARLVPGDIYAVVKRTADKGAHWSATLAISSPATPYAFPPVLSFRNGVWRAAFERCTTDACVASRTYYTQSSNGGATWSGATIASTPTRPFVFPGGVGFAGKIILLLGDYKTDVDDADVYVRVGS
jgi:hypothetical protein